METRSIGSLEVSVVGLGTNNFGNRIDKAQTADVLDAAFDNDINFIDTADTYGGTNSEAFIGELLGSRRSRALIATKFGMSVKGAPAGGRPEYVRQAAEESLRRLNTDCIDLYIYHRPDGTTPISSTLEALAGLVSAGKVREIGCSNFSAEQLREAESVAKEGAPRFVNVQNSFSLLNREPEQAVLAECVRQAIGFVPYSPLVGGLLTGKFRKGESPPENARITNMPEERRSATLSEENLKIVERLIVFAEARGHTLLELAVSWLLAQPAVSSVIAGASDKDQVRSNVAAARWTLSQEELALVDEIAPVS